MKSIINKIPEAIYSRFLKEILYYLPLFFLVLGLSPNFTSPSINNSIFTCGLLLPAFYGFVKSLGHDLSIPRWAIISLLTLFSMSLFFLTDHITSLQIFTFLSTIGVFFIFRVRGWCAEYIMVICLFTAGYLSINQYGFEQLLQAKFILNTLLGGLFFTVYKSKVPSKWSFIFFPVAFLFICFHQQTISHYWWALIAVIPALIHNVFGILSRLRVDLLTGILWGFYFIYYFLYANHVIQALTGGL